MVWCSLLAVGVGSLLGLHTTSVVWETWRVGCVWGGRGGASGETHQNLAGIDGLDADRPHIRAGSLEEGHLGVVLQGQLECHRHVQVVGLLCVPLFDGEVHVCWLRGRGARQWWYKSKGHAIVAASADYWVCKILLPGSP